MPAGLASREWVVGGITAVVVVAVGAYLAFGGPQPGKSGSPGARTAGQAKNAVHMLRAGQTGLRASVPWSLVGSGWTLAEMSAAKPNATGAAAGPGLLKVFLVDPVGGKYLIRRWTGASDTLLAWSGDATHALLRLASGTAGAQAVSYVVLTLATGQVTSVPLKADVTPVGFTRPNGQNILAIRHTAGQYQLRRYGLQGEFKAQLSTMPNRQAAAGSQPGCPSQCNALSSPDGKQAVWGVAGNEMQLVSNTGGINLRLHAPYSGTPPSCVPVSWWSASTVLANCAARGQPNTNSERLWLVPANGAAARPLAPPSGSPSRTGFETGAWTAGGHVYLTQTTATQCLGAASGPGGLGVLPPGHDRSVARAAVRGTHTHDNPRA